MDSPTEQLEQTRLRVHDLRHVHASWLVAGGADLQVVKERGLALITGRPICRRTDSVRWLGGVFMLLVMGEVTLAGVLA